ncbi:MAG: arabinose ABC transporter substrate-binding protein [Marinisporobacter sp.]|nr:arabinose ABC transporter substrate-binding protein [Marinisporobacter sp.]
MKKLLAILLITLLTMGVVTGCGSEKAEDSQTQKEEKDGKIVIAGIYKALDQVWFIDESTAAKEEALKLGADDMLLIDAKMNPDTYLAALDNVISQGVDGILVCVPDQQLSKATVDRAKNAGIPIIAVDDALQDQDGKLLAPWVGIDSYDIGKTIGNFMVDYVKENETMEDVNKTGVLLLTMDTVSSCVPRTKGQLDAWNEKMPDFPKENIFTSDYNGETAKGFDAAAAVITANPNIKTWLVMAPNDEGSVGATRALEQAGLDKESVAIGLGGHLSKGEFEREYSAFKASAYINSFDVGRTSAKEMIEHVKDGKEIPERQVVSAKMVTKENYKEIMKDALQ